MSPMLIAMAGLPGTGKSTLATALADALPAVVLDKDKLRTGLIPPEKIEYSRAQDDYVFELLLKAAEYNLNRGRHVILDGRTFTRRYQVERVVLFANEVGAELHFIECVCPEALALQRLAEDRAAAIPPGRRPRGRALPLPAHGSRADPARPPGN